MFRLLVMPEICFLFLHGWNLKFSNQTCHFRASHHPTPQCCRVLSQTHTPTITLHRGIILFMSMVSHNTREHVRCFLRKVSLTGGMPQKKHVLVEGDASSIDWRVNFLEAAVNWNKCVLCQEDTERICSSLSSDIVHWIFQADRPLYIP